VTSEAVAVLPTSEDRIRAALWFAEHGFGVFSCWSAREDGTCRCPAGAGCDSPGKHPVTGNGFKDATRDPARIRTFLSAGSEPNYGLVPPPGVFAWDVDGGDLLRLAEHEGRLGPLPATLETLTAHGRHLFLRWPDGFPRPVHRMFGFVTRWGSGELAGYVIGPRSVHPSGAVYTPAGVAEIATLPDAWAQSVLDEQARPRIRVAGRSDPAEVRVGGRHDWLRDTARHYAGVVRDPDALFAAVWADNRKLAEPKTEDAVRRAIGDVLERFGPDPLEEDPDTGEIRRVSDDEVGLLGPAAAGEFPPDPDPVAFAGLLGESALALGEGTDASLVGILGALLAFAGALIPGQAYQHRMQTTSPFVALVGESSVGRKGTAMWRAHDAMAEALEPVYVNRAILDGLNSGEGLISTLSYKQATFPYEPTVGLVFEEEYASLLAARGRDGSTLDPKMRAAFDGGPLSNRRSSQTQTVAPPYWLPALIAITPAELRRRLEPGALESGSANRWLHLPVRRREAPPVSLEPRLAESSRVRLQAARRWAIDTRLVLPVDAAVTVTLSEYAEYLPGVSAGTARDLTKRLPVIAFRVALVHAMAERSERVGLEHLDRALALTEYARAGIDWVFGGTVGNRDADLLLRHLQRSERLTRRQAERIVRDTLRRQDAIDELVRLGYAQVTTVHETRGRPRDELRLARPVGTSSRFSQVPATPTPANTRNRGTNGTNSVEGVGGTRDEGGTKSGGSGRNEPVIDRETGEVASPGEAIWASPCRDYRAHQDHHRNTAEGWVCLACEQGGAS
jgi:hypothetical protein